MREHWAMVWAIVFFEFVPKIIFWVYILGTIGDAQNPKATVFQTQQQIASHKCIITSFSDPNKNTANKANTGSGFAIYTMLLQQGSMSQIVHIKWYTTTEASEFGASTFPYIQSFRQ